MDWATTLAKELKQRENPQMLGAILGIVITPPPALKISILNGSVFITNCYILQNIVEGYTKIATIPEQTATGTAKGKGTTNIVNDGGEGAIPHSHTVITDVAIKTIGIPSAEICFEDTLKAGDEVLLVVSPDNQTYFVIGKVKKIGDE
ncbi:MAG: DUF2577 family protein [Firmicutes bacterium]|nr:DUF2577 family protein [Bacillota bacterium]